MEYVRIKFQIHVLDYPQGDVLLQVSISVYDTDYAAYLDEKQEVKYRRECGDWDGDVLCEQYGHFAICDNNYYDEY